MRALAACVAVLLLAPLVAAGPTPEEGAADYALLRDTCGLELAPTLIYVLPLAFDVALLVFLGWDSSKPRWYHHVLALKNTASLWMACIAILRMWNRHLSGSHLLACTVVLESQAGSLPKLMLMLLYVMMQLSDTDVEKEGGAFGCVCCLFCAIVFPMFVILGHALVFMAATIVTLWPFVWFTTLWLCCLCCLFYARSNDTCNVQLDQLTPAEKAEEKATQERRASQAAASADADLDSLEKGSKTERAASNAGDGRRPSAVAREAAQTAALVAAMRTGMTGFMKGYAMMMSGSGVAALAGISYSGWLVSSQSYATALTVFDYARPALAGWAVAQFQQIISLA